MPWYVLRDLTRSNSLNPAYKQLASSGFETYTPMCWRVRMRGGVKIREYVPVIHDLLFVRAEREDLDPLVERIPTLQYRYVRGGYFREAMTVDSREMERFIHATLSDSDPKYLMPGELTPAMVGKRVEIIGGPLDGYTGNLLKIKGMRKKRLIVELKGMLVSAVEVEPDFIRLAGEGKQ